MKSNDFAIREQLQENLRKWFKEKWVRFGPDGKIRGACARGDDSEGKPKCLPQAKAHALGKKGRKYAAAKKRREDPNPERRGPAKNVATKKKTNEGYGASLSDIVDYLRDTKPNMDRESFLDDMYMYVDATYGKPKADRLFQDENNYDEWYNAYLSKQGVAEAELDEACWKGYHKEGNKKMFGKTYPNCVKNTNEEEQLDEKCWDTHKQVGMKSKGGKMVPNCVPKESVEEGHQQCPECGGAMYEAEMMNEKKDACYYKVKSRYKVWPSAYASGALVKCRKKGASNWGTGGKSNESVEQLDELSPELLARYKKAAGADASKADKEGDFERGNKRFSGIVRATKKEFDKKSGVMEGISQLEEKWSQKYKNSINCSNPKGFSQRAHCQGKKKK